MKEYSLIPKTFQELMAVAKLKYRTPNFLPSDKKSYSVEDLAELIRIGLDLGLNVTQAVEGLLIINGKVCVWGDVQVGLVWASGKMVSLEETFEGSLEDGSYCAVVTAKRKLPGKDEPITIESKFSVEDAKKAGLWGKNPIWKKYPKRMLNMRARSWTLRDGFSDVLRGLVAVEEAVDYEGHPQYKEAQKMVEKTMQETTIKDDLENEGSNEQQSK